VRPARIVNPCVGGGGGGSSVPPAPRPPSSGATAPPGCAPQERQALPCLALACASQERFPGRCPAVTLWIVHMSNNATRAATLAAAAADAAALSGGTVPPTLDGGGATDSLPPGGNAADAPAGGGVADPPAGGGVDGVLHRLELSLDAISTRLSAVEAGREAARDPPCAYPLSSARSHLPRRLLPPPPRRPVTSGSLMPASPTSFPPASPRRSSSSPRTCNTTRP